MRLSTQLQIYGYTSLYGHDLPGGTIKALFALPVSSR